MRNANFKGMHLLRVANKRLGIALVQLVIERIGLRLKARTLPPALASSFGQLARPFHNLAPSFTRFRIDRLAGTPS
jgi:hypothetical protein